jgi:predicted transcriptional regulator
MNTGHNTINEPVIVLDPGEERAQIIARAISSRTAGEILHILAESPGTLSDIAEKMNIPLTRAKYHVDNLVQAGIIEIAMERYSVKGRPVKIYALTEQVLVVAPKKVDIRAMLLKYSSVFGIYILVTGIFVALYGILKTEQHPMLVGGGSLEPLPPPSPPAFPIGEIFQDPQLLTAFFAGGCIIILLWAAIDIFSSRRR